MNTDGVRDPLTERILKGCFEVIGKLGHGFAEAIYQRALTLELQNWGRIIKLANDHLPKARILHPWPEQRFAVKHPRWEPYAGKPHARFCAGGAQ